MFDPLRAIATLNSFGVDYVVVGGWATLQHGATRLTEDLDICPKWSPDNLDRLGEALTDLRAELSIGPRETIPVPVIDQRLLAQMEIGNWDTDAGRLDVLRTIPGSNGPLDFAHLRMQAVEAADESHSFLLASLAEITESKRAAGRPKDLDALPELDRLLIARVGPRGTAP